jgi:aspartate aminotransferase
MHCAMPKGAFYAFPNIKKICETIGVTEAFNKLPKVAKLKSSPSSLFQKFLLFRYGVATMDRRSFGRIGAEKKDFLRISLATSMENLKTGISLLQKASVDADGFASFMKEGLYV